MPRHLLVVGDSLAFHGPDNTERPGDVRLWPNVAARALGRDVRVDLVARLGWTARDGWWALTKDPLVWGELVPRADALVIGLGGMDALPASIPTYLRDGIPYLRPGGLRRWCRNAYRRLTPPVIRATGGRMRQLPQVATDHYLARTVAAVRHWRPDIDVVLLGPAPHASREYPSMRNHVAAVESGWQWATEHGAAYVDVDPFVWPSLREGRANPDGLHWAWDTHQSVGEAVVKALVQQGWVQSR